MAQKIRVLHYIWSANFGGIEKLVFDLTLAQITADHVEAKILIGCKKGSFLDQLNNLNIPHEFAGLKNGMHYRRSIYIKIRELMKTFDIIHLHTFHPMIFSAAIASGKKIVYTIHGNFNFGRELRLSDRINQRLRKFFLNRYPHFISFNSKFTKQTAEERYELTSRYRKVIYNGVFMPNETTSKTIKDTNLLIRLKGKFVVGTSSRFAGFKRIDRLIDAFAKFAKNKSDVSLLLVGDGILKPKLANQVNQLEIEHKTIFTGFQNDVRNYQKLMNVCVFPSQNEPFGLVAVETLSLGKPTLLFKDAGGMLEIISDYFPDDIADNIDHLVERIQYYYDRRNSDFSAEAESRKTIASKFDIMTMENEFFREYQHILSN